MWRTVTHVVSVNQHPQSHDVMQWAWSAAKYYPDYHWNHKTDQNQKLTDSMTGSTNGCGLAGAIW